MKYPLKIITVLDQFNAIGLIMWMSQLGQLQNSCESVGKYPNLMNQNDHYR